VAAVGSCAVDVPPLLGHYLERGVSSVHAPAAFVVGDMSTMAGQLAVTLA
jgi:hypothetical protein